jgi:putative FmdB family regulatory protein
MPTYEYECQSCGHKFDLLQTMSAAHVKKCPKCKKNSVKRLISAGAGIIFKGSGFYATDYKRPKTKDQRQERDGAAPKCSNAGKKDGCSSCPGAK